MGGDRHLDEFCATYTAGDGRKRSWLLKANAKKQFSFSAWKVGGNVSGSGGQLKICCSNSRRSEFRDEKKVSIMSSLFLEVSGGGPLMKGSRLNGRQDPGVEGGCTAVVDNARYLTSIGIG
jgi:hypothetical protein